MNLDEYTDPGDVMSSSSPDVMVHPPVFTERDGRGRPIWVTGTGSNAAQIWGPGWLDDARTWRAGTTDRGRNEELWPLHWRELPGFLAARSGLLFVQLRISDRWDHGMAAPAVLVLENVNGTSVRMRGTSRAKALSQGDGVQVGDRLDIDRSYTDIRVVGIDGDGRRARLDVARRPARRTFAGPAIPLGSWRTGGQTVVIVGGKPRRIPPRSPLAEIVEQASLAEEIEGTVTGAARDAVRREALTRVRDRAELELQRLDGQLDPSPAQRDARIRRQPQEC